MQKRKTNAKTKPVKYLAEVVLDILGRMQDRLNSDEGICYIKELLVTENLYDEIWAYYKRRYKDNIKIIKAIKKIEDTLENRIVRRMAEGRYSTVGSIFILKNKYRWIDKVISQNEQEKDASGNTVPLEIVIRGHKEVNNDKVEQSGKTSSKV